MPIRPWLSAKAQVRETAIGDRVDVTNTASTRDEIDRLVERNVAIHERECINLNPATNVLSPRAEAALASKLGTRPSLGHAGEKYEMGLEAIEELEVITADLAGQVFGSAFAEIRPLSGAMANLIGFMACSKPGDAIIVPPPSIGGHVTHNIAGAAGLYGLEIHEAPIDADRYTVDVGGVRDLAEKVKPSLITVGASLNLLPHPVRKLRTVADDVGATLMFDAAHACGMFAGQQWPNPLAEGAHLMTMSTYKSLAGPAGGLIVTDDAALAERIDAIAYPGLTANFDAGRTTALAFALADWIDFGQTYAADMRSTASALAQELMALGVDVFATEAGPTDSHQFAIADVDAATNVHRLRTANLLTCEIGLPSGPGIRLGTPEMTRWGMAADDMTTVAGFIHQALDGDPSCVADQVTAFRQRFTTIHYCN